MRFGKKFQRRVGGSGSPPVLGSDSAPIAAPDTSDNQMQWQLFNVNGFPIQRIVVGYSGPAMAANLSGKMYLWDDLSGAWYLADTKTLVPGTLSWFDQPSLGNTPQASAGSLEIALVVSAAGGDPNGTYTFVLGADFSNAP